MKKLSALLLLSFFVFASCDNNELDPPVTEENTTEYQQDGDVDDVDPRSEEERTTR